MKSTLSNKRLLKNRKGIVIFVVIGVIFFLAVLVVSYNYLVRGKFNESREILRHLRVLKCAQATSNLIFSHLLMDLQNQNFENESSSHVLLNQVFKNNTPDKLGSELKSKWFKKEKCDNFVEKLLYQTIGNDSYSCDVDFIFTDIHLLSELKRSKKLDEKILFFNYEKVGRLTIRVTINVGNSNEIWQETRPFKVVVPFPIPITKFTFYWKDGVLESESYDFNNVTINAETGMPSNGKYPFLFDNGSIIGNETENVWQKRGWIYIGGNNGLYLNRACGDKKYGQRFYSYPRFGLPITLLQNFDSSGGDNWNGKTYNGKKLGFRVAEWGFSDSLLESGSNNIWAKILKSEFKYRPINRASNKKYWYSSSLHLFSDSNAGVESNNIVPSVTRIIGKVSDRYLEMGYLMPEDSSDVSDSLFAAIINYSSKDFENSGRSENNSETSSFASDYTFEKYLYFSNGYNYENSRIEDSNTLQDYFDNLIYEDELNPYLVSYKNVMSKVMTQDYDVTYNVVSNYSNNSNKIDLPPPDAVPNLQSFIFKPNNFDITNSLTGNMPEEVNNFDIREIGNIGNSEDKSYGLSLRTCYEINAPASKISNLLKERFVQDPDSNNFELNLNNLVYKLTPSDGQDVYLGPAFTVKSPGTIFSEGPITLGRFSQIDDSEKFPIMVLAEKGAISVENSESNEIRAYLIALGDNGTVKYKNDEPLKIRGGMAVKEFKPNSIPNRGGYLAYNLNLDPTVSSFDQYLGIVFGPSGGKL